MSANEGEDSFDFDEQDSGVDMKAVDANFLQSIESDVADLSESDSLIAWNFWFLVVVMVVFTFLIVTSVMLWVRARRRREAYAMVGYLPG